MKAYLLDSLNGYNRLSEKLDVKAILCNRAWDVFNEEEGNNELYIFQKDGTILITINGDVSNGTWKYIPANKSVIITLGSQSKMVHPVFVDETLLVLKLNGIEKYSFLIDEKNTNDFFPTKILEIEEYITKQFNSTSNYNTDIAYSNESSKVPVLSDEEKQEIEQKEKKRLKNTTIAISVSIAISIMIIIIKIIVYNN